MALPGSFPGSFESPPALDYGIIGSLPGSLPGSFSGKSGIFLTATPNDTLAYIQLNASNISQYTTITIVRTVVDTGASTAVRGADGVATAGFNTAQYLDYEAPLNTPVTYTITGDGADNFTTPSVQVTVPTGTYWLKNVSQENLSMQVKISEMSPVRRPARILAEYPVLGRQNPILQTDLRGGRQGHMKIRVDDVNEASALLALLETGDPLFFQCPPEYQFPDMYFVAKDLDETWAGVAGEPIHLFEFDFTEQDSPSGVVTAVGFNDWNTVVKFGTWQNLMDKRPTWLAVLNAPYTTGDAPA